MEQHNVEGRASDEALYGQWHCQWESLLFPWSVTVHSHSGPNPHCTSSDTALIILYNWPGVNARSPGSEKKCNTVHIWNKITQKKGWVSGLDTSPSLCRFTDRPHPWGFHQEGRWWSIVVHRQFSPALRTCWLASFGFSLRRLLWDIPIEQ